jgi:hypothetical protein
MLVRKQKVLFKLYSSFLKFRGIISYVINVGILTNSYRSYHIYALKWIMTRTFLHYRDTKVKEQIIEMMITLILFSPYIKMPNEITFI